MIILDRVKDKVIVVTGGALGIGRATCILLAKEGAKVAVTDINHEKAHEVVEEINSFGGIAKYWAMDVSNEEQIISVYEDIEKTFGAIDVLVNNAGISGEKIPTDELTQDYWNNVMKLNSTSVFLCTKYVIPQMRKKGKGSIINLSSIAGLIAAAPMPAYHASKGAVRLLTKCDAITYASENIRVNSIHPAYIWTPMVETILNKDPDPKAAIEGAHKAHPIGHMGEPLDVAYAILYLASDESKFVTGTEIVIDGGYTAR